jgi:hypothetical protein
MMRLAMFIFVALVTTAQAQPLPYPKPANGQCAGSYMQPGGFCVPKSGGSVREAIPKPPGVQCPSARE